MIKTLQKFFLFKTTRQIAVLFLICAPLVGETRCPAVEISAGIGALEEGDDRGRSAAILAAAFANNWWTKTYVWGRSYGPVTETAGIISVGKRFDFSGSKSLRSAIGFSSLAEHTAVKYSDSPSESSSFTSTNFGLMLGMHYDVFKTKNITITGSWDSHLFAAGEAILLLVTGRKQILGLTATITL
ncbi:MAG: hypothetical protein WCL28_03775 [bacterium]